MMLKKSPFFKIVVGFIAFVFVLIIGFWGAVGYFLATNDVGERAGEIAGSFMKSYEKGTKKEER